MNFSALCAGEWLLDKARIFGMWARKWELASDSEFYFPASSNPSVKPGEEIRIAFYARSNTPRRATTLGIAAFEQLQRRGFRFKVFVFGEEPTDQAFGFPYEHKGIISPEQLGALYRDCHIGVVFSTTNYSLVPLEMMACDLPVVEVDTESTRAVFKNGEVSLASPNPEAIASTLERLTSDVELRRRQRSNAQKFIAACNWKISAHAIESAIRERLQEKGFLAIEPGKICAPTLLRKPSVSVIIPSFNAGSQFKTVLKKLTEQDTQFKYDILVIDSGSTDQTVDTIRSFQSAGVSLHQIPNNEFQHGRTRNLAVSMTEGDYVAILTQDATPADKHWLAKLIGGFSFSDRVAGVIGRHKGYPEHGGFVARDLDNMFDRFADFGQLYSVEKGLPSFFYRGGVPWQMNMQFYSDNNSAISRSAWKVLPYPEIEWGEDQVWAWEMLKAGFHKAYVDDACVFHSHNFLQQQHFKVCLTEGIFFAENFGWSFYSERPSQEAQISQMNTRDLHYAVESKIPRGDLKRQMSRNKATVEGRAEGSRMASDF